VSGPDRHGVFVVTGEVVKTVQDRLEQRLRAVEAARADRLHDRFVVAGIMPPRLAFFDGGGTAGEPQLDQELQRGLSELVVRQDLSLEELIRIWRNETESDSRPNKALDDAWLSVLLLGYEHADLIVSVIQHGVVHKFDEKVSQPNEPPVNRKSAGVSKNTLYQSIKKGQHDSMYLVVDLNTARSWNVLHFSPFGCVPKAGVDPLLDARLIHDLKYPIGASTNAASVRESLPPVRLVHVRVLARCIEALRRKYPLLVIMIMKGDVKGAFRHIPLAAAIARWFAGCITDSNAAVVDLALPFGWTGSPAFYGVFGGAITYMLSKESPSSLDPTNPDDEPFFGYEWVDVHVLLEVDRNNRLEACKNALRLAMMATLGPRSINDSKFSSWCTRLQVLGFEWDTSAYTVSIPEEKIAKAILRIDAVLGTRMTTKHQLAKLLGSLRHVCSCVRPAKAFYQRLVSVWRQAPQFAKVRVSADPLLDLYWFRHIIQVGGLRSIPTSYFAELPEPDVHLFMDASNTGLCVLHPAAREYLRVQFDADEIRLIEEARVPQPADAPVLSINVGNN
jgi:hypothetical protein